MGSDPSDPSSMPTMRERFHLLIVHPETNGAIVGRLGGRWLLPFLFMDNRARAASKIEAYMRGHGARGFLACIPCGRVSDDLTTFDRLAMWVEPAAGSLQPPDGTEATALERLTNDPAWLPVQQDLYAQWLALPCRHESAPRSFDSWPWFADTQRWVEAMLRRDGDIGTIRTVHQHRASLTRVVVEFESEAGTRVYFKGDTPPFLEGRLTVWLASRAELSCPRVLAMDDERGWMLSAASIGRPLTAESPDEDYAKVTLALACLQVNLVRERATLEDIGLPMFNWPTVVTEVDRLLLAVEEQRRNTAMSTLEMVGDVDDAREAIRELAERMDRLAWPLTWVDTDLAPGNVFLTPDLEFVDLEKSMLAFPHLALETFLANVAREGRLTPATQSSLRDAYADVWRPYVSASELIEMASLAPLASRMVRMAQRGMQTDRILASGELVVASIPALKARAGRAALKHLSAWHNRSVAW